MPLQNILQMIASVCFDRFEFLSKQFGLSKRAQTFQRFIPESLHSLQFRISSTDIIILAYSSTMLKEMERIGKRIFNIILISLCLQSYQECNTTGKVSIQMQNCVQRCPLIL